MRAMYGRKEDWYINWLLLLFSVVWFRDETVIYYYLFGSIVLNFICSFLPPIKINNKKDKLPFIYYISKWDGVYSITEYELCRTRRLVVFVPFCTLFEYKHYFKTNSFEIGTELKTYDEFLEEFKSRKKEIEKEEQLNKIYNENI